MDDIDAMDDAPLLLTDGTGGSAPNTADIADEAGLKGDGTGIDQFELAAGETSAAFVFVSAPPLPRSPAPPPDR